MLLPSAIYTGDNRFITIEVKGTDNRAYEEVMRMYDVARSESRYVRDDIRIWSPRPDHEAGVTFFNVQAPTDAAVNSFLDILRREYPSSSRTRLN